MQPGTVGLVTTGWRTPSCRAAVAVKRAGDSSRGRRLGRTPLADRWLVTAVRGRRCWQAALLSDALAAATAAYSKGHTAVVDRWAGNSTSWQASRGSQVRLVTAGPASDWGTQTRQPDGLATAGPGKQPSSRSYHRGSVLLLAVLGVQG
jgi:hypothetical protein